MDSFDVLHLLQSPAVNKNAYNPESTDILMPYLSVSCGKDRIYVFVKIHYNYAKYAVMSCPDTEWKNLVLPALLCKVFTVMDAHMPKSTCNHIYLLPLPLPPLPSPVIPYSAARLRFLCISSKAFCGGVDEITRLLGLR